MDITLLESHKDYNRYNTHFQTDDGFVCTTNSYIIVIPKTQINDLYIVEDKRSFDMSAYGFQIKHIIFYKITGK